MKLKNRMDAFGIRGMKSEMLKGERTNTGKRNWQKAKQNWVNEDGRGGEEKESGKPHVCKLLITRTSSFYWYKVFVSSLRADNYTTIRQYPR